jgi:glycosyltransferase involved in cell wall biosynthesis
MKLGVINDWHDKKSAVFWNKDGFLRALQILKERDGWEVKFFKKHDKTFTWQHDCVELQFSPDPGATLREWNPDAVLFFSDLSRPILEEFRNYPKPKAICFSGGRHSHFADVPDLVFTESKSYIPWLNEIGAKRVIQAFGTNTELFRPMEMPKYWDGFFPATGASWKRHELFGEALGPKGLVCGWWQETDIMPLEHCKNYGVGILHHQMPESLVYLYNMAHTTVITSSDIGGSQRTVLEAMACNRPVIVMSDSTMTTEYLNESGEGTIVEPNAGAIRQAVESSIGRKVNTREWVLENYSEYVYAAKIRDGILSLL